MHLHGRGLFQPSRGLPKPSCQRRCLLFFLTIHHVRDQLLRAVVLLQHDSNATRLHFTVLHGAFLVIQKVGGSGHTLADLRDTLVAKPFLVPPAAGRLPTHWKACTSLSGAKLDPVPCGVSVTIPFEEPSFVVSSEVPALQTPFS